MANRAEYSLVPSMATIPTTDSVVFVCGECLILQLNYMLQTWPVISVQRSVDELDCEVSVGKVSRLDTELEDILHELR